MNNALVRNTRIVSMIAQQALPHVVAIVFLLSALAKAAAPDTTRFVFDYSLSRLELQSIHAWSYLLVVSLLSFEITLSAWLLSGWRARAARRVALGTLMLFTVFLIFLVFDPAAPPCACTGWISLAENARTANILGVGRNLVLIALLLTPAARTLERGHAKITQSTSEAVS